MSTFDKLLTLIFLVGGFCSLLYGLDLIHASLPWIVGGLGLMLIATGGILRASDDPEPGKKKAAP